MINRAVERYEREADRHQKMVDFIEQACRQLIAENAIPATVQSRTKSPSRLRDKLRKRRADYTSVEDVFGENGMDDLAGVRIATYIESDRERVVAEIVSRFVGPDGGEVPVAIRDAGDGFYRATHCQIWLTQDDLGGRYGNLGATTCEIQVCSLLAHVWNEVQHDLEYKPLTGELSRQEKRSLDALGNLTRAGDSVVQSLLEATDARLAEITGPFVDQWDFVSRTRRAFPEAADFGTHSGQLFRELLAEGLDSPQAVEAELLGNGAVRHAYELFDRFDAYLEGGDGVVHLARDSSDPLLMLFLEKKAGNVLDRHPGGRGQGRPPRIASAARRFLEMEAS